MKLDKRGLVLSSIGKPIHYKGNILSRLGGKEDVFAIMTTFCIHLQNDSQLARFYGTYKLEDLRLLMIDFFNAALLLIFPRHFDLKQHIAITQYHQLSTGMGPREFDLLVQAFRNALSDEPIPDDVVEETIQCVATLRRFFEDEKLQQRAKKIADAMEDEKPPPEIEIQTNSGNGNGSASVGGVAAVAPKVKGWSRGKRRRKLGQSPEKEHESQDSAAAERPIRHRQRRGSLQFRIKSAMPIRRISVPKENDKDPGPLIRKKSLENNDHSSLTGGSNGESSAKVDGAPTKRSGSKDSQQKKSEAPASRNAPTGSFSFSHSRDVATDNRPARRRQRRGSLQFRIKSAMPIRRISVPKENDKGPGPSLDDTNDQSSLTAGGSKNDEPSAVQVEKNAQDDSSNKNQDVAQQQQQQQQQSVQQKEKQEPSKDVPEPRIRRMPRRGSLQYRIKSVLPARRISVPKENDKDPGPSVPPRPSLLTGSTKSSESIHKSNHKNNSKSTTSVASVKSNNTNSSVSSFNQKPRGASPHRRLFQVMRRMGSKDKDSVNGYNSSDDKQSLNDGYNDSSDDEGAAAVLVTSASEEEDVEDAYYPTAKAATTTTTTSTTATTTNNLNDNNNNSNISSSSYKQQPKQEQHPIPGETEAYGKRKQLQKKAFGEISGSWENALVL